VTFTKDWQRVGDMAARTIVIRKDSIAEQRLMAPSAISTSWNVPLMRSRSHPASDSAFRWRFTITAAIAGGFCEPPTDCLAARWIGAGYSRMTSVTDDRLVPHGPHP